VSTPDRFQQARSGENLMSVLGALRRRWEIVLGVIVVSVGVLAFTHEHKAKTYSATASVAFQSTTLSDQALQVSGGGSGEPQREADTEVLIAHSPEVARAVAQQLHISGTGEDLLGDVKVEAAPNADVLNLTAENGDPRAAAELANAFAEQYIAFRGKSQLSYISVAQTKLQQEIDVLPSGSTERTSLEGELQRLSATRAVVGGGTSIIGRATPPGDPTGSGIATSIAIGLLIGLAVAFTVVFLLESLDRRMRTIEEFEREYRLPVLSGVPQSAARSRNAAARTETLEPFRILRSALDFVAVTRELKTLLVTSAISGEGKTTVAIDLAHAVALTGRRTILVELDLRRPTFAEHLNLDPTSGLTSVLTGGGSLQEMLVQPLEDVPNLLVLPCGRLPHNPAELLGSARVAELIQELAADSEMLILDAPPLNPVADAQVLLSSQLIDAAILVGRTERTRRDEVRRARAILDRHIVEPVGIVVTGLREAGPYDYNYYRSDGPTLDADVDTVDGSASRSDRARAGARSSGRESRELHL
jgi:polysaccharide biosynthesis transport protein